MNYSSWHGHIHNHMKRLDHFLWLCRMARTNRFFPRVTGFFPKKNPANSRENSDHLNCPVTAFPVGEALALQVAVRGRLLAFRRLATRVSVSILAALDLGKSDGRACSTRVLGLGPSSET